MDSLIGPRGAVPEGGSGGVFERGRIGGRGTMYMGINQLLAFDDETEKIHDLPL